MSALRWLSRTLGTWPGALVAALLLAGVVLLGGISASGLWDPQERAAADKNAPPIGDTSPTSPTAAPAPKPAPPPADGCYRQAPPDATARSMTPKAMAWGRDALGDSDAGRRLPFALIGILLVLASAGTAMRLAGARAGLVTACVLLAMPLCTLQSRLLTSEIGTPAGAALLVYGFTAFATLNRRAAFAAVDIVVAVAALLVGAVLAFTAGGALLGVAVPLLAVAAAGSFGASLVCAVRTRRPVRAELPAAVATVAVGVVIGVLAYQLFSLKPVVPGLTPPPARELFGHAFIPTNCWSDALGGLWKPEDDLRVIYDSAFEQIAYGTFPWGVLAPLACAALLASGDDHRRRLGALSLAWAAGAWLATEVFARKVGFNIYAGFPAMAIAIGAWIDSLFAAPAQKQPTDPASSVPVGAPLIAVFALLAMLQLGRDLQGFPEKLTSLLTGSDQVAYPKMATLLGVGIKVWVLAVGLAIAVAFGLAVVSRSLGWRRIARWSAPAAIGLTVLTGAFWAFAWEGKLGEHLSVKALFDTYKELRAPGDQLVIMGDLGRAPHSYADAQPELVADRPKVVAALGRPQRVFAILPQSEICPLHREMAHKPYFVLDDRNLKQLLISNRVDGTTDKNPLAHEILHEEPTDIPARPKDKEGKPARIVFDNKIELLGWRVPAHAGRGASIDITLYFKVLAAPGGAWSVLGHFDGPGLRFNGDHKPIEDHCGTNTWQAGDYIVDTFTVKAASGPFAKGAYEFRTGFFTGSSGNFKNMAVTVAPANLRDSTDRVFVGTINLD